MTDYHAKMLNVPCEPAVQAFMARRDWAYLYQAGHRDARHACAEIAIEAQREIEELRRKLDYAWREASR